MGSTKTSFFYQVGSSLAKESPSYIERIADRQLEMALKEGEFCYVLNSRQMGKSSLRVRSMSKLQERGVTCAFIDLNGGGTQNITAENWYAGILKEIVKACQIEFNWRDWWREHRDLLTPVQRLSLFIEEILLVEIKTNIVIFIDEIDGVLSQSFCLDDFFTLIHGCYQKRQSNSNYYRLTFVLLGVAAPKNLIKNRNRSPFELGKAIDLQGFKLEEAEVLTIGLLDKVEKPKKLLAEIIAWTAGQPFLTQKICQLVREKADNTGKPNITKLIEKYVIKDWQAQDEPEHLRTICDRFYYRNSAITICLLELYQNILQKKSVTIDNSIEQIELRLSGLVVERRGRLEVHNPIYARVFNLAWIEKQLTQLRPYERELANWIATNNPIHLLKGKVLQDASIWSLGKSLADLDYRFLAASHNLAKQRAENELADVIAANELLAKARKTAANKANKHRLHQKWLSKIVLAVTVLIMLLRYTGILQTWEWNLLDRFFRWHLSDAIEPRIVVVTVDEKDLQTLRQYPVSDLVLATAIENLKQARPSAIGLDLYRDLSVPPGERDFREVLSSTANLYVAEKIISNTISPPPNISRDRIGFTNLAVDSDGKVRRALLSTNDKYSLGTKLALHYLRQRNIELKPFDDNNHRYGLGKAIFERLNRNSGGYVRADARGYKILLNYWGTQANFKQYSLTEVMKNDINPKDIRENIVLIGSGSNIESSKDSFYTPYSKGWFRSPIKMPGIFIHANITSQIISAAVFDRPLLRTYNEFAELSIVLFMGIVGAIVSSKLVFSLAIAFYTSAIAIISIVVCYQVFLMGWWLPLVPALLTLVIVALTAILIRNKQRDSFKFERTLELILAEFQTRPIIAKIALENLKRSENKASSYLIKKHIKKLIID